MTDAYRVLLIDDDPDDRALYSNFVLESGRGRAQVVAVASMGEAIDAVDQQEFDVCLLDLRMQPISGLEMLPQLRAHGLDIPIIAFTNQDDESTDLAALQAGADGFVSKARLDADLMARTIRYARAQFLGRQQLMLQVGRDPVSGAYTRREFVRLLQPDLARIGTRSGSQRLACVSIRRLHEVNERYGREAADRLLVIVAQRLREAFGRHSLVGRLDGGAFVVFAGSWPAREFQHQIELAIRRCAEPVLVGSGRLPIDLVAGTASFPEDAEDALDLVGRAEVAMRAAKESGVSGAVFAFDLGQLVRRQQLRALEEDLHQALQQKSLSVVFEPFVALAGNRLVGAEVLCRWQHPKRGPVSPAEFIPMAESLGLINELTDQVLDAALAHVADWQRQGLVGEDFVLSVNIPAEYLQQADLDQRLAASLAGHGLPGSMLALELTERSVMDASEATLEQMNRLRGRGMRLVIDDFGTGYSSLSYLCRLPVDGLKVDRTFLKDLNTDPRSPAVVRSILALGGALNLQVIVEGVEDEALRDTIRTLGAEIIQGYVNGRPRNPEQFAAFLAAGGSPPGGYPKGSGSEIRAPWA